MGVVLRDSTSAARTGGRSYARIVEIVAMNAPGFN
jgi:hypothetical protein